MDLKSTVAVNKKILMLIESKYPDPPSTWTNTPETRYYRRVSMDTTQAQQALEHGGLSTPQEPD